MPIGQDTGFHYVELGDGELQAKEKQKKAKQGPNQQDMKQQGPADQTMGDNTAQCCTNTMICNPQCCDTFVSCLQNIFCSARNTAVQGAADPRCCEAIFGVLGAGCELCCKAVCR